jgi:hypothetical protein
LFAFDAESGHGFDEGAVGELVVGLGTDEDGAERCLAFEAGAGVDCVADDGVFDVAPSAEFLDDRFARVHADAESGPAGMLVRVLAQSLLEVEGGARGA